MKFFIDTANVEDIKKANDMGVICGVTTNPSLIAKEGRDFGEVIREIASIVDGPISGEVKATTEDAAGMIAEGREIAAIHPNMVVKIPMTVEGLKATKVLSAEGIKCNVTLIFSANQALLAARAGAAYVSPFLGRLDDISMPGIDLVRTIADMFAMYDDIHTEIIAASVRNPVHVTDCALAGADIATVPYSVIEQMTKHPLTDAGIAKFRADYEKVFGKLFKPYRRGRGCGPAFLFLLVKVAPKCRKNVAHRRISCYNKENKCGWGKGAVREGGSIYAAGTENEKSEGTRCVDHHRAGSGGGAAVGDGLRRIQSHRRPEAVGLFGCVRAERAIRGGGGIPDL